MNESIFFFFYNFAHQSELLDKIVIFFAVYFPYLVIFAASLFLFRRLNINSGFRLSEFFKKWKDIFSVFFAGFFAMLIAYALKFLIHTSRPPLALPEVYSLFPQASYAFPSGHATFFGALAVSLFYIDKKLGYMFMFFALLIGLARITAGVHFPVDIAGGLILGSLVTIFINHVFKK